MSLRRVDAVTQTGAEHVCVGAGTHLMADECCFANSAPCAGPICGANSWPYGINLQLVPESKIDCISHGPRAVCVRAAGMVRRQVCGLRQRFRRALGTERADGKSENKPYLRAHIQIQTDVQTEPRDRKPFGRNLELGCAVQMFHVKHTSGSPDIVPFICATESPPQGRRIGMSLSDFFRASGQC